MRRIGREMLPKRIQYFSNGDLVWLWYVLSENQTICSHDILKNPKELARVIGSALRNAGDDQISWIVNDNEKYVVSSQLRRLVPSPDKRTISWLIYRLVTGHGFNFYLGLMKDYLSDWDHFLLAVDVDAREGVEKLKIIKEVLALWNLHLGADYSLGWIDESNAAQASWLLDEGVKAGLSSFVPGSIDRPLSSKESVTKFKCMLDQSSLSPQLADIFVSDLRRKWSVKNNKKRMERCQTNVLVLPETRKGIKELMKRYNYKTQGEVVDDLVSKALSEYEHL
ncbi:MAG: hypothetical protein RI567_03735 [Marinobacter sp.]|nr:hypothetical protein [Marinobacter sp.]